MNFVLTKMYNLGKETFTELLKRFT